MNVLLTKLSELQLRAPWRVLVVALASLGAALVATSQLRLRSQLGELLPADKPSVIVADRIAQRLPAISTLSVVVELPHSARETDVEHGHIAARSDDDVVRLDVPVGDAATMCCGKRI